jgi:hypothetical protein
LGFFFGKHQHGHRVFFFLHGPDFFFREKSQKKIRHKLGVPRRFQEKNNFQKKNLASAQEVPKAGSAGVRTSTHPSSLMLVIMAKRPLIPRRSPTLIS